MKLELAKKIVALDQRITATKKAIEYFKDPDGYPRLTVQAGVYATWNLLENVLGAKGDQFNKELNGHIIKQLEDHRASLQEQLRDLDDIEDE